MNPIDLPQQAKQFSNIKYIGEYRSPQDLPNLYDSIDLVWACYQPIGLNDWNLRWARTNRFYESCCFKTPIISRLGSSDGMEVSRYDIGLVINAESVRNAVDTLSTIDSHSIEKWNENISVIPPHVFRYTTELAELESAIRCIAQRTYK